MYDAEEPTKVTLLCKSSMMKILIDNFGVDVDTTPVGEDHFEAKVSVCTSPTFYSWVFGFNDSIKITAPESVINNYGNMLRVALEKLV